MKYYLLYTRPGSLEVKVLHTGEKVVTANEGNQHLLEDMAQTLIREGLLKSAQVVGTTGELIY